jgi:hypothetical protein
VIAVATGAVALGPWPGTGKGTDGAPPAASRATASATTTAPTGTALPPLPLTPRTEDPGVPVRVPARIVELVAGNSYPYDWYSHCGMVYITLGGKVWKVDHPVTVPAAHPDAHGIVTEPLNVPGYVTVLSPTALRFDAPTYITGVPLHVTDETPPLCQ